VISRQLGTRGCPRISEMHNIAKVLMDIKLSSTLIPLLMLNFEANIECKNYILSFRCVGSMTLAFN